MQNYPKGELEIIIADGGSTDGTLDLVKSKLLSIPYSLIPNLLKTGEAGKAVGIKQARNEIIALIDSDNILPQSDWFQRMVEPFQDPDIVASEPLYYTYRRTDPYITRYCALLGMNDSLCLFLGNYDRYCSLTGKWTEMPHIEEDMGNYLKIEFPDPNRLPTIGANGFLIRRETLQQYSIGDYLFDIDIIYDLVSIGDCKIAKVKVDIIHLFCKNISQFIKKQKRRVKDYLYFRKLRRYPWNSINRLDIMRYCVYNILVFPLLLQAVRGNFKKQDSAWLFHPIACIVTFLVYGLGTMKSWMSRPSIEIRQNW